MSNTDASKYLFMARSPNAECSGSLWGGFLCKLSEKFKKTTE
ncbi:hypothetical protein SAMN05216562_2351 [Microbulbifer marinus]|uniref:Uncharacterized protein n=1 Tax=Microbulbifer marinus TaxID=658218 RepID=A0A1H3ZE95_9GAMM|nr:hypothetical protein SAMN05216562_2351 [Microbulbifer marinus]